MENFAPLLAALALVWKLVDFAKQVRVRNVDGIVTQLVTWVAGVLVITVLAHSDFGAGVKVANMVLGHLNTWSLILIGLSLGSGGSVAYDFKRALDRTDSAAQPSLVTGLLHGETPTVPKTTAPRTRRTASDA